jgi:hypothetical protein
MPISFDDRIQVKVAHALEHDSGGVIRLAQHGASDRNVAVRLP